jgi:hypothetical protein
MRPNPRLARAIAAASAFLVLSVAAACSQPTRAPNTPAVPPGPHITPDATVEGPYPPIYPTLLPEREGYVAPDASAPTATITATLEVTPTLAP